MRKQYVWAYRNTEAANMLEGLSKRIRTVRMMQGMSLKDVARESHCSASMLSRVENEKQFISIPMLTRVAATLNIGMAWLLEGDVDDMPRIHHLRSRSRRGLPTCTAENLAELEASFGRTSSSIRNVHIIGRDVLNVLGSFKKPAACLVLDGVLGISSKTSSAQVKAGGFFQISGLEAFLYRNASESNASMMVISM